MPKTSKKAGGKPEKNLHAPAMAAKPAKVSKPAKPARAATVGKTAMIRARVDPTLKETAERVLDRLGLNASDAIRLFYSRVVLLNGLPFEVKLPNATTEMALREVAEGKLTDYESIEAMRRDLDI